MMRNPVYIKSSGVLLIISILWSLMNISTACPGAGECSLMGISAQSPVSSQHDCCPEASDKTVSSASDTHGNSVVKTGNSLKVFIPETTASACHSASSGDSENHIASPGHVSQSHANHDSGDTCCSICTCCGFSASGSESPADLSKAVKTDHKSEAIVLTVTETVRFSEPVVVAELTIPSYRFSSVALYKYNQVFLN